MVHEGSDKSQQAKSMSSHLGINGTIDHLNGRFFWHGITKDVTDYINSCDACQHVQSKRIMLKPELQPISVPEKVMSQVGVDITSLPEAGGLKYLIVLVDYFSKWIEAKALADKSATSVATFLFEVMCRHGCFQTQINDQGREFVNSVSECLHHLTGTEQRITSAYHPQANGLVERSNQTIKSCIIKTLGDHVND